MEKKKPQGFTTEEEFSKAILFITSCRATLNCGCQFNELQAELLYYKCKHYMRDYEKLTENK